MFYLLNEYLQPRLKWPGREGTSLRGKEIHSFVFLFFATDDSCAAQLPLHLLYATSRVTLHCL